MCDSVLIRPVKPKGLVLTPSSLAKAKRLETVAFPKGKPQLAAMLAVVEPQGTRGTASLSEEPDRKVGQAEDEGAGFCPMRNCSGACRKRPPRESMTVYGPCLGVEPARVKGLSRSVRC